MFSNLNHSLHYDSRKSGTLTSPNLQLEKKKGITE